MVVRIPTTRPSWSRNVILMKIERKGVPIALDKLAFRRCYRSWKTHLAPNAIPAGGLVVRGQEFPDPMAEHFGTRESQELTLGVVYPPNDAIGIDLVVGNRSLFEKALVVFTLGPDIQWCCGQAWYPRRRAGLPCRRLAEIRTNRFFI